MGSPITLGGFNKIDFTLILNAIMEQERVPLRMLQTQKSTLESQVSAFATLATKLGALETAAENLSIDTAFGGRSTTITDSTAVTVTPGSTTPLGTYDVEINELARAQVTGTTSTHTDKDTTIVATGGTLTIGGVTVTISSDKTLQGLADAINATSGIGVTAAIVQSSSTNYQLVLTGKNTGATNAFTITNSLTGGTGVTFGGNSVEATDASVVVNNITVTSASNTISSAIPGATLTALKKDPGTTITVTVTQDTTTTKSRVDTFAKAFNDLLDYIDSQSTDAKGIGRDTLVRSLRDTVRDYMTRSYSVGGTYKYLAEVGIKFTVKGRLEFDKTAFDDAIKSGTTDAEKLFIGSGGVQGAFAALKDAIELYTQAGGLVPEAKTRLDTQKSSVNVRIGDWEQRLALRRAALQQEMIAADQLMTQLNNQLSSLGSLGAQYRLF